MFEKIQAERHSVAGQFRKVCSENKIPKISRKENIGKTCNVARKGEQNKVLTKKLPVATRSPVPRPEQ